MNNKLDPIIITTHNSINSNTLSNSDSPYTTTSNTNNLRVNTGDASQVASAIIDYKFSPESLDKIMASIRNHPAGVVLWRLISIHQTLTFELLEKYEDELDWQSIARYQILDSKSIARFHIRMVDRILYKHQIINPDELFTYPEFNSSNFNKMAYWLLQPNLNIEHVRKYRNLADWWAISLRLELPDKFIIDNISNIKPTIYYNPHSKKLHDNTKLVIRLKIDRKEARTWYFPLLNFQYEANIDWNNPVL